MAREDMEWPEIPTRRDARCRGCSNPVGADAVKIGKKKWHPDCATRKPRSRQVLESGRWRRLGVWNDEEDATLKDSRHE